MRNERGITLVELLAALAIVGIIIVGIMAVLSTGSSSADRTASKQRLQQEANQVVESIRATYLDSNETINLVIDNKNNKLLLNERIISQGYEYVFVMEGGEVLEISIDPKIDVKFEMEIVDGNRKLEKNERVRIETRFSKLR